MIYVITESKYDRDETYECFVGLVDGDQDPKEVIWKAQAASYDAMRAWRATNPRPKGAHFPDDTDSEAAWVAYGKAESEWRKYSLAKSEEHARINALLGKEPIDILLKNGFRVVPHTQVSL